MSPFLQNDETFKRTKVWFMLIIKVTSGYHKESQIAVSLDKYLEAIWNIFKEQNETKYLKN